MELFEYYLTGRHFMGVTDHASLTWLWNLKESEGGGGATDHTVAAI